MKKILFITLCLPVLLLSCQKDNTQPPVSAAQAIKTISTTYNKATLSSTDSLLIGLWQIDSIYNRFPGSSAFIGSKMDSTIEYIFEFTDTLVRGNEKYYKRKKPSSNWDYNNTWEVSNGRIKNVEDPRDSIIYISSNKIVLETQVTTPSMEIVTKTVFIKR